MTVIQLSDHHHNRNSSDPSGSNNGTATLSLTTQAKEGAVITSYLTVTLDGWRGAGVAKRARFGTERA